MTLVYTEGKEPPEFMYVAICTELAGYLGELINTPDDQGAWIYASKAGPVVISWHRYGAFKRYARRISNLRKYGESATGRKTPIILVLYYVGDSLREKLLKEGIFWVDLSGNARIDLPELKVDRHGVPNKFIIDRRRDNPASQDGTRVLRLLLLNPKRIVGVRELAALAGVDKGMVSRLLKPFCEKGWIELTREGIWVRDTASVLAQWRKRYRFHHRRTEVLQGQIKDPSVYEISNTLTVQGYDYAWTMMPAAWVYDQFGEYTHYAVYIKQNPYVDLQDYLKLMPVTKKPNVWIIVAGRRDTWDHIVEYDGINYVDPFRAYCDLKACPDPKADYASQRLREFIKIKLIRKA